MKKKINKRKGLMLVLSSPSGAGKTSICRKIVEKEKNVLMSVSYTTRPKRKSEKDGTDYYFVSKKKFESLCMKKFFVEYANVFDYWYGTPKKFIETNLTNGIDIIFDIDWQGTQKLADFSKSDIVSVFILPPSTKILLERLKKRAEDSEEIVTRRMKKAKSEINHWIEYDYVLINENIENCVNDVLEILNVERKKRFRQKNIFDFVEKLIS